MTRSSERDSNAFQRSSSNPTSVLGFCTGLFPAAAVAISRSIAELLELAPKILCVTLRVALEIGKRSELVESSEENWAKAVTGLSAETLENTLEAFHNDKVSKFTTHSHG